MDMSVIITHDLGVIVETADQIEVMYLGQIMESGSVVDVFIILTSLHPGFARIHSRVGIGTKPRPLKARCLTLTTSPGLPPFECCREACQVCNEPP